VDKKKDRPYGEKYEGEDMRAAKIIKEEKEAKQKEEAEQSELFDTAMTKVWEDSSTETAEEQEENYQNLLDVVDDVPLGIDHCLKGEERTLLMQVVGTHLKTTLSMLDTLLSKKPNITLIDEDGWTAIHWASFHGNSEALSRLLAYNVEVRKHLLMCYQSKLTCSWSQQHAEKIIPYKDQEDLTPLGLAKDQNNQECIKVLEKFIKDHNIELEDEEAEKPKDKDA